MASNEVIVEVYGENSHIKVSSVPKDTIVKIINFPCPSKSRIVYPDLTEELLSNSYSYYKSMNRTKNFAIYPKGHLDIVEFHPLEGDIVKNLRRIFSSNNFDFCGILDHYALYVPMVNSDSDLRVITKCDDQGQIVNINDRDITKIQNYLSDIDKD